MESHAPSSGAAADTPTAARGAAATARRPSYTTAIGTATNAPPAHEPATYTLLLLGALQHFAAGARVKEIALQLDSNVRQVSCGADWLCLVTDAGRAYSFGGNTYGQLAQGHTRAVAHPAPVRFPTDRRIVRVSCGASHGGFLLEGGALFMFGCGSYGRLGTGSEAAQATPVAVRMHWRDLEAAATQLTREPGASIPGSVWSATAATAAAASVPSQGEDDEVAFVDISCGERHTLLLGAKPVTGGSSSGAGSGAPSHHHKRPTRNQIITFGDGTNGRLGLGSERDRHVGALLTQFRCGSSAAAAAFSPPTFASVHAGASHNAAVSSAGELFTWGLGADGQLGHGALESEWVPRDVAFFRGNAIAAAACGAKHTVAVSRAGVVYAWGRGAEGQLGGGAAHSSQPQLVALAVDPAAAQQAQIEAQLASGVSSASASFSTGTSGSALLMPDTRVVVRAVLAHDNASLALDDQARLFVWGDNAGGQLGLAADAQPEHSEQEEPTPQAPLVTPPRQLRCMEICEPKKPASRVRDRVPGASRASLSRVALTHVAASDRFSALLFRTKQPANALGPLDVGDVSSAGAVGLAPGTSASSPPRPARGLTPRQLLRKQSTLVCGLDDNVRWQLSLAEPLQPKDVPSREAAFYRYMAEYHVSIRPRAAEPENDDDDSDRDIGGNGDHDPAHSSRRRDRRGRGVAPPPGAGSVRRSSLAAMSPELRAQLLDHFRAHDDDEDAESAQTGHVSKNRRAAEAVRGFDAWLERQLSPSKPHGFGTAPRFHIKQEPTPAKGPSPRDERSSNQKDEADSRVRCAAPTRPHSSAPRSQTARPRPPKSAFGRSVAPTSARGSIAFIPANRLPQRPRTAAPGGSSSTWRAPSIVVDPTADDSAMSPPLPSKDTRQRLFNQFVAPFGSSVSSRFGMATPRANDTLQLNISPDLCAAAVLPRSPGVSLGNGAEQYSLVTARRLREANGALPGPGTYDRRGG